MCSGALVNIPHGNWGAGGVALLAAQGSFLQEVARGGRAGMGDGCLVNNVRVLPSVGCSSPETRLKLGSGT